MKKLLFQDVDKEYAIYDNGTFEFGLSNQGEDRTDAQEGLWKVVDGALYYHWPIWYGADVHRQWYLWQNPSVTEAWERYLSQLIVGTADE